MFGKKGKSHAENIVTLGMGILIAFFFIVTLFSTGIFNEIISSLTQVFGALGAIIGILFVAMIIIAVFENTKRK